MAFAAAAAAAASAARIAATASGVSPPATSEGRDLDRPRRRDFRAARRLESET